MDTKKIMGVVTKREVIKNGATRWLVDYGRIAGQRKRCFFRTSEEADAAIADYQKNAKKQGDYLARLNEVDRLSLASILMQMDQANVTPVQVWTDWQRWRENKDKDFVTPMPYGDVVKEWEKRKLAAGKTVRYVEETRSAFMKFGEGRQGMPIHKITPNDLEQWINRQTTEKKWSKSTRRTHMVMLSSLWEVALAKGWANLNIVERLEPVTVPRPKIRIYDNQTVMNIMAGILENPETHSIIASTALGLFGCMRPEEIESAKAKSEGMPESDYFNWRDIDLEHGLCKVRITKTCDERTVRLQPNCLAWLKLAKEKGNPLPPINERRLIDSVCELIGLNEWIRDGLRKNCMTHLRTVYKNDYDVVRDCGNSIRIMLRHYAALHTPESVSLDYWKITPERVMEYMKTPEWRKALSEAGSRLAARSASETAKTAG